MGALFSPKVPGHLDRLLLGKTSTSRDSLPKGTAASMDGRAWLTELSAKFRLMLQLSQCEYYWVLISSLLTFLSAFLASLDLHPSLTQGLSSWEKGSYLIQSEEHRNTHYRAIPTDEEDRRLSLSKTDNTFLFSSIYFSPTNFQLKSVFVLLKWKLSVLKIGIAVKMRKTRP